jgi:nitrogenase molybdenum-iron protein beta chain
LALANIIQRHNPELIAVITTCLSETTGDDIHGIAKAFRAENPELASRTKIVTINTPSYVGTHVLGYDNAIKAMVTQLGTKTAPNNKINIIPGIINPGDVFEIKHVLELMGVDAIYLTDVSKTLNAPLKLPKPHFPPGGTTVAEIADSANSLGTMVICRQEGQSGANALQEKFGVPACIGELPIGVESTEIFLDKVAKLTGKQVPESLLDERDLLVDAMVDSSQLTFGTKVAIFGDPDIVLGLARFAYELGMQPVHVMTTFESSTFAADMKTLATDYGTGEDQITIIVGGDLYELHQRIKEKPVDLIIGDCKGKYIAKEEHIPLVRVGFPQSDRFGYQRKAMLGFRGSLQLLDSIVNTIMDARD